MANIRDSQCGRTLQEHSVQTAEKISGASSKNSVKAPDVSVPKPEKWTKAGEIVGDDFSLAYRTFDAQYWYTPLYSFSCYLPIIIKMIGRLTY